MRILLEKSSANEEEEADKQDKKRKALGTKSKSPPKSVKTGDDELESDEDDEDGEDDDIYMVDDAESSDEAASVVTGSFIKIGKDEENSKPAEALVLDDDESDPDFYDIDVAAWDSHCSALHLAILGGHTEVVKLLCQEFAADVLKPFKIKESDYSDHVVILTLVLALALPTDEAVKMAETLLSVGATPSQADLNGVTAFHRYVQLSTPKLIECLWENDKVGLKTAINHVAVSGYSWNPDVTTPLMSAIDNGDPIMVLRLLETGANPQIDFNSWLKGAKFTIEDSLSTFENNQNKFKSSTEQPLVVAIRSTQPISAVELLNHGADPNTITKSSHNVIENEWARRNDRGYAALDVARRCLEKLRKYEGEKTTFNPPYRPGYNYNRTYTEAPGVPIGTDEFLSKFTEGTYQHWVVHHDIKELTKDHEKAVKQFQKDRKNQETQNGSKEKREAIDELISQLEQVEKALLDKGGKTFSELYPKIQAPPPPSPSDEDDATQADYKFEFSFTGTKDVTEVRQSAYIEL